MIFNVFFRKMCLWFQDFNCQDEQVDKLISYRILEIIEQGILVLKLVQYGNNSIVVYGNSLGDFLEDWSGGSIGIVV